MKRVTLLTVALSTLIFVGCDKESNDQDPEPKDSVYVGLAYVGQSIPEDTIYSYSEGSYSATVLFSSDSTYIWNQTNEQGNAPEMTIPCEYNTVTGAFENFMEYVNGTDTYGQAQSFPVSFCIDDLKKLYLFTFDLQVDTNINFPRTIAEKTSGVEGTMEGSYTSSFKSDNWLGTANGLADMKVEADISYTYTADAFSGTAIVKNTSVSDIEIPDYGITIGTSQNTETITFSGTWTYDKATNTITEVMTVPESKTFTYTPYWVSYNNKTYMVSSLTRVYEKTE